MSTWLKFLPMEMKEVEELIEPIEEIKEGETVAGEVSDDLKRLWTLAKATRKAAELLEVELRYNPASAEDRGRATELMSKARIMEAIFWVGAMDEFQLWSHTEQCALRVGWQVVEFKQTKMPFPFKLFGLG